MAITAAQVKELREMTGAGMMDCKKALTATEGDMDKAVEFLREKGLLTMLRTQLVLRLTPRQTSLLRTRNSSSMLQMLQLRL